MAGFTLAGRRTHGRPAWASRFELALAALTLLGLAIRVFYALHVAPEQIQPGDPKVYRDLANELAHGRGYQLAHTVDIAYPTASHPPLYPLFLAFFTKLGLASFTVHRCVSCLLGAAAVALVGALGRRVAGPRAGLIAAGLAAVYPQLFMVDGTLIAESLYAPVIVLVVLLSYRFLDRPSAADAAALGAVIGVATLTRSEGILLLFVLAAPLAWRAGRGRIRLMAVIAATAALVLSPWLVRNWVRFDRFPLLSSNGGLTQGATNCEQTFRDDRYIGFVFHPCALGSSCLKRRDEIARSECLSRQARAYIRDDVERVPLVVAARVARLWNLYAPRNDLSYGQIWARERTTAKLGMAMYALLALAAILGAVILRRRKVPVLPLLAMFVMASLTAAIAFGFSRYRLSAEPALIVLAAVGLDGLAVYAIRLFHDGKAGRRGQHAPT